MWKWVRRGACLGCLVVPVAVVALVVVLVVSPLSAGVGAVGRGPAPVPIPSCNPMGSVPASPGGAFRRVVGPGC